MSHAECREHICAVCYSESGLKASRLVSEGQEKIIRNEFSFILDSKEYGSFYCYFYIKVDGQFFRF